METLTSAASAPPQVKICGLTDPQEARACADLGAAAIGLVFYPPSPRHLSLERAAEISAALPSSAAAVGVFVEPTLAMLEQAVARCGLAAVQLHGRETPELVQKAATLGVTVIKALFTARQPGLSDARHYNAAAYLVECGKGRLPGGNAEAWAWADAHAFARRRATILAGGLTSDNVARAIAACLPAAVDASSGLEAAPGRKDLRKVAHFIAAVRGTAALYASLGDPLKTIFGASSARVLWLTTVDKHDHGQERS